MILSSVLNDIENGMTDLDGSNTSVAEVYKLVLARKWKIVQCYNIGQNTYILVLHKGNIDAKISMAPDRTFVTYRSKFAL